MGTALIYLPLFEIRDLPSEERKFRPSLWRHLKGFSTKWPLGGNSATLAIDAPLLVNPSLFLHGGVLFYF